MPRLLFCFFLFFSFCVQAKSSDLLNPSVKSGIAVAVPHSLATETAEKIFQQGGNAFDAAVAVAAVLGVVQPYASGLGGGGWWLLHTKQGEDVVLDSREVAPAHLPANLFTFTEMQRQDGPMAALIPGEPAAFVYVNRQYGTLPLHKVLEPAIYYAEKGFKTDWRFLFWLNDRKEAILKNAYTAALFFEADKNTPKSFIRQPELANTLKALAKQGHKGYYEGTVARAMVAGVNEAGGVWTVSDLAAYAVKVRHPIHAEFENFRLTTVGPPSSGGLSLISMLEQAKAIDWRSLSTVDRIHTYSEMMRRAACERSQLGDPDFVQNPDAAALRRLRSQLPPITAEATPSNKLSCKQVVKEAEETTHFVIHDAWGNRATVTLSNNFMFGSGFVEPHTGVLLNNHLDDFTFEKDSPNAPAARKRPLSSIAPNFFDSDCLKITLGTPGGFRIPTMNFLALMAMAQGNSLKDAIAAPRFHQSLFPDVIQIENKGFAPETITALKAKHHAIEDLGRQYGDMQGIVENVCQKTLEAQSDERGVGMAEPGTIRIP